MATRQCNQLCFYQKLAILWMFFSGAVSCMLVFSSSSEVEMRGPSHSQNSGARKYIMKSYFDNYENLHDSSFEDFMAHKISSSLLQIEADSSPKLPAHFCDVVIIQRLPLGVFADPFELQHLHQRKVFTNLAVFGDTNLELPSFRSNRSVVEVHMDAGSNMAKNAKSMCRCVKSWKESNVIRACLFISPNDSAKSRVGAVAWRMHSGMKAHTGFVSVVAFVTAFLSTLSIVVTSIFCSGIKMSKNLKRS